MTLDAYWIDRTEVTKDQYQRCVDSGQVHSAKLHWHGAGRPSGGVRDVAGCGELLRVGGAAAADGGGVGEGGAGDGRPEVSVGEPGCDGKPANFRDSNCSYDWKDNVVNDGYAETAPVGSYPAGASPYGALDLAGNVWEWVADWYAETYYASSPAQNPVGPASGKSGCCGAARGTTFRGASGWRTATCTIRRASTAILGSVAPALMVLVFWLLDFWAAGTGRIVEGALPPLWRRYTDRKSYGCKGSGVLNLLRPMPEQVRESGMPCIHLRSVYLTSDEFSEIDQVAISIGCIQS